MQIERWFFPSTEQDLFYRHKKAPVNTEALVGTTDEISNHLLEDMQVLANLEPYLNI